MLLGQWLHGVRLDFLEYRKRWQIKLYGLWFLHSVWDNTLMTFSQALESKAWSFGRENCSELWIHVKCSGICERGTSDPIQYHTPLIQGERGTVVWLCRSCAQLIGEQCVTSCAPLTCSHQATWPGRSLAVCLPCWIPWTGVYTCILNTKLNNPRQTE